MGYKVVVLAFLRCWFSGGGITTSPLFLFLVSQYLQSDLCVLFCFDRHIIRYDKHKMVAFSSLLAGALLWGGQTGMAAQLTKVNYPNNATSKAEM